VIDDTWHPVLPSTTYSLSIYARASAAVSMQAGIEWKDTAGAAVGSPAMGTGTALSTSDWSSRPTVSGASPAGAAYGVPILVNTTTTGAAVTVYVDNPQMEENPAATAWVIGSGIARVATAADLGNSSPLAGWESPELTLIEL
jgi:hypothetical protein